MNGQNGSTEPPTARVASSTPRASFEPSPRPSKLESITVWVNDIVAPRRVYSAKPATSPSTTISNRPASGLSTMLGCVWFLISLFPVLCRVSWVLFRTRHSLGAVRGIPLETRWSCRFLEPFAVHGVECVVRAHPRLDVDDVVELRGLPRVDPHDEPLVLALQRDRAVDECVGAQLLDQVDVDRHAAVVGADQVGVLGPEAEQHVGRAVAAGRLDLLTAQRQDHLGQLAAFVGQRK